MKNVLRLACLFAVVALHAQSLDRGWRFHRGDAPGAERPDFKAAADWPAIDLPHDWSIEGPFEQKNPAGGAGAFLPSGVAWYRTNLPLPRGVAAGRRYFVEFDGAMQNSDVWINGQLLGHRPNGYVKLRYELTPHLRAGETNVLAVKVATSAQPASRWYAGAGIYRHARLLVTGDVHFASDGVFVSSRDVSAEKATVHIEAEVMNQSAATAENISVKGTIGSVPFTSTAQSVPAGGTVTFALDVPIAQPKLWGLDSPELYRANVQIAGLGAAPPEFTSVEFGIRDAHFESATGFWLNGKNLKLKGVCLHSDGGAFGAAVPNEVLFQRLNALRTLGVNAIRTAHNPPDPVLLELCDGLGFVVMDECFDCWTVAKNPQDYHLYFNEWSKTDLRETVRRDRNHPSVILYSAGNEIHDTPKEELAKSILAGLVKVYHETDPTRPVTQALFRPNVSHDYTNGLADLLDVIGTNYRDRELLVAWQDKPGRKIVGTEQQHNRETWLAARDNPQHAGQFLWSGVDYLGESRAWPNTTAGSGLLDRTGQIKPMALERRAWWSDRPVVGIVRRIAPAQRAPTDPGFAPLRLRQVQFADWTPDNREPHEENVEVYSNCEEVELFLNGKSLGAQKLPADAAPRMWKVPFAAGTLRALGRNAGADVARDELRIAGAPARLQLVPDADFVHTGWDNVRRVTVTIVDRDGIPVPSAADHITFAATGPGLIVATDNADGTDHEPFSKLDRAAYQGRCVAWVRATSNTGAINVTATAPGLTTGTATLAIDNLR